MPIRTAIRLGWLVVAAYAVGQRLAGLSSSAEVSGALLMSASVIGWLGWMLLGPRRCRWLSVTALIVVAVCGGALAAFTRTGIVFPAVAALSAGLGFDPPISIAVTVAGPAAIAAAIGLSGGPVDVVAGGFAAAMAGLVAGTTRRQERQRIEQRALLDVEHERAEALADRNHLAREVHDVLAHTLGAVSLQLEALDGDLAQAGTDKAALARLRRTRQLVVAGLDETRLAVRALRERPIPLADQLAALAADRAAELSVVGSPRPLAPEAALALYRAAQEALTNAAKHAPGAPVTISVEFGAGTVTLTVTNLATSQHLALAATGAGYGLQGIRERMELLGGRCRAGPTTDGWQVEVEVTA